mgnify:CR=1 FL=1
MQRFGSLSLGSRLKRLSDRLIADVVEIYQVQGIPLHPTFFPLFSLLHGEGAMPVTQAAELLGVSHPAISKIARKMIDEGWVTKTADPADERRQLLALTEQSEQLLVQIRPIWAEIKRYLDQLMDGQQHPLLASLGEFESLINAQGFVAPVLEQLEQRTQMTRIDILPWDASLRDNFKALNLEWLDRYFDGELTAYDREALDNPEGYYLARGGYIWFALNGEQVIGTVALARHSESRYEISKMGVEHDVQGLGVGRQLILTALDKAREQGASEVFLETASKLGRAMRLYQNIGFREIPHPDGQSVYPRSDVYMQLTL